MKRFFLLLSSSLFLLTSCQNTPKTAQDPASNAEPPASQVAPLTEETLKQTLSLANSSKELALSVRNELDQLPGNVKNKNKEIIDAMYNDLEGIMTKESMMAGDLEKATDGGKGEAKATEDSPAAGLDPATVKDYSESIERYNTMLQEMQSKVKALKGGN